jgi:hypothetical protein
MSVVEEGCSLVRGCCSSGLLEAYIVFFVRRGWMFTREGLVKSNDLSLAVHDGYRVVS